MDLFKKNGDFAKYKIINKLKANNFRPRNKTCMAYLLVCSRLF